jgi:hypothetical protein
MLKTSRHISMMVMHFLDDGARTRSATARYGMYSGPSPVRQHQVSRNASLASDAESGIGSMSA